MAKRKSTPSALKKEANRFDKIFKENLRRAIPAITSGVLNLRLVSIEMVTVELQRTRERKADFVAIVEDENGERFVLHIEFQVRNDGKMVYRMNDYNAVLMHKYPDLEIRQYVIFLGKQKPKMQTGIQRKNCTFQFSLIWLKGIDYRLFLKREAPEEIMLGILADFGRRNKEVVVQEIFQKVTTKAETSLDQERFWAQLRVLADLRNFGRIIASLMESITTFYRIQRDPLFQKGLERGRTETQKKMELRELRAIQKRNREFAEWLLSNSDFSLEKIAASTGVEVKDIKRIKARLEKQKADAN